MSPRKCGICSRTTKEIATGIRWCEHCDQGCYDPSCKICRPEVLRK